MSEVSEQIVPNDEVLGVIRAFEQILEVMPYDLATLESLWRASSDIGDTDRAMRYLLRLGHALEEQNDASTARRVLEALQGAGYTDARVDALIPLLEEIGGESKRHEASVERQEKKLRTNVNVADELSFAWYLLESELLTQDEYARVADALSEMSSLGRIGTVSVLHALDAMGFPRVDRLIEKVATDLVTPFLDIRMFDIALDAAQLPSVEFMTGRGVLPFELLDRTDALVGILNPFDKQLREDVVAAVERQCHFFLVAPMAFDDSLKALAERLASAVKV